MKVKFIFGLATATMLMAASCSQEEFSTPNSNGDEATISLAVNVPNDIQTRAFGDGTSVDRLQYALYKNDDNTYTRVDEPVTVNDFNGSHTLQLKLLTGSTYKLVFWADNSTLRAGDSHPYVITFGENEAKMKLLGTAGYVSANFDANDAFFAFYEFTVNGDLTGTIELKRPFAQINFGTNDLTDYLEAAGYSSLTTALTVTGSDLPDTLDLMTGEVSGDVSSVFFNSVTIPKNETFPVGGYDYLAMAYLLIGDEQELVSVTLQYAQYHDDMLSRTVNNVPVRRNYRTNIYGQVLTSNIDLNVVVAPEFEESDLEPNPLELVAGTGGTVKLTEDLPLDKVVTFTQDAVLDLNGQTISSVKGADGSLTVLGSNLVIKGEGTMKSIDDNHCTLVWADKGGTIVIEDGTFTAEGINDQLIYIGPEGGTIYVQGGTFRINDDPNFTLNCYDTAYRNGTAKFVVSGGKFYKFNPAESSADTKDSVKANWLAPGYKSVRTEINGEEWYEVVPDDTVNP